MRPIPTIIVFIELQEVFYISIKYFTALPKRDCKTNYWFSGKLLDKSGNLLEAKRMLYYTTLDVKQIAYELGYEDYQYFSRFFKKNTAMTALEFRNAKPLNVQ